ncbi:cytochrome P450, partial [Streptomyces hainanensis]
TAPEARQGARSSSMTAAATRGSWHIRLTTPRPGSSRGSAAAAAVEELLRFDGPVELATWRFASEPLTLGGQRVERGDPVLVVLAAADRDPARFPDPDRLDLGRTRNPHLGYGHGIHYCLGAPLARLEARAALGELLSRLPGLRLAADVVELRWRGGLIMRGLRELPVVFTAEPMARGDGASAM